MFIIKREAGYRKEKVVLNMVMKAVSIKWLSGAQRENADLGFCPISLVSMSTSSSHIVQMHFLPKFFKKQGFILE